MASSISPTSVSAGQWPALIPLGHLEGKPPIPLKRILTVLGARPTAHINLKSKLVSQTHAAIVAASGAFYIRDMASRSHTFVNDQKVREALLHDGDQIKIGEFVFRVAANGLASEENPAPAGVMDVEGEEFPMVLSDRTLIIGRRATNDLPLADETVSTVHAIIFSAGGKRMIRDLGSRTGTFVNGQKVHQQDLTFGDEIQVGPTSLRYQPDHTKGAEEAQGTEEIPVPQQAPVIVPEPAIPEPQSIEEPKGPQEEPIAIEPEPAPKAEQAPEPEQLPEPQPEPLLEAAPTESTESEYEVDLAPLEIVEEAPPTEEPAAIEPPEPQATIPIESEPEAVAPEPQAIPEPEPTPETEAELIPFEEAPEPAPQTASEEATIEPPAMPEEVAEIAPGPEPIAVVQESPPEIEAPELKAPQAEAEEVEAPEIEHAEVEALEIEAPAIETPAPAGFGIADDSMLRDEVESVPPFDILAFSEEQPTSEAAEKIDFAEPVEAQESHPEPQSPDVAQAVENHAPEEIAPPVAIDQDYQEIEIEDAAPPEVEPEPEAAVVEEMPVAAEPQAPVFEQLEQAEEVPPVEELFDITEIAEPIAEKPEPAVEIPEPVEAAPEPIAEMPEPIVEAPPVVPEPVRPVAELPVEEMEEERLIDIEEEPHVGDEAIEVAPPVDAVAHISDEGSALDFSIEEPDLPPPDVPLMDFSAEAVEAASRAPVLPRVSKPAPPPVVAAPPPPPAPPAPKAQAPVADDETAPLAMDFNSTPLDFETPDEMPLTFGDEPAPAARSPEPPPAAPVLAALVQPPAARTDDQGKPVESAQFTLIEEPSVEPVLSLLEPTSVIEPEVIAPLSLDEPSSAARGESESGRTTKPVATPVSDDEVADLLSDESAPASPAEGADVVSEPVATSATDAPSGESSFTAPPSLELPIIATAVAEIAAVSPAPAAESAPAPVVEAREEIQPSSKSEKRGFRWWPFSKRNEDAPAILAQHAAAPAEPPPAKPEPKPEPEPHDASPAAQAVEPPAVVEQAPQEAALEFDFNDVPPEEPFLNIESQETIGEEAIAPNEIEPPSRPIEPAASAMAGPTIPVEPTIDIPDELHESAPVEAKVAAPPAIDEPFFDELPSSEVRSPATDELDLSLTAPAAEDFSSELQRKRESAGEPSAELNFTTPASVEPAPLDFGSSEGVPGLPKVDLAEKASPAPRPAAKSVQSPQIAAPQAPSIPPATNPPTTASPAIAGLPVGGAIESPMTSLSKGLDLGSDQLSFLGGAPLQLGAPPPPQTPPPPQAPSHPRTTPPPPARGRDRKIGPLPHMAEADDALLNQGSGGDPFQGLAMPPVRDVFSQMPSAAINDPMLGTPSVRSGGRFIPADIGVKAPASPAPAATISSPPPVIPSADIFAAPEPAIPQTVPEPQPQIAAAPKTNWQEMARKARPEATPKQKLPSVPVLILLMLLCLAAALAMVYLFVPVHHKIEGKLFFQDFELLTPVQQTELRNQQKDILLDPETRTIAKQILDNQYKQTTPGFLDNPLDFARIVEANRASFWPESGKGLFVFGLDTPTPEADANRVRALIAALYLAKPNADKLAEAGKANDLRDLETKGAQLQSEMRNLQVQLIEQERLAKDRPTDAAIRKLEDSAAEADTAAKKATSAVLDGEAEIKQIKAGGGDAIKASDTPTTAPADDAQLRQMKKELTLTTQSIRSAKAMSQSDVDAARRKLDAAVAEFQKSAELIESGVAGSPELKAYLDAATDLKEATKQITTELIQSQKEQQDRIIELKHKLEDKIEAHNNEIFAGDAQLKDLNEQLALTRRKYNASAAAGDGHQQDADALRKEVDRIEQQVEARQKALVGKDTIYADALNLLQEVIDLSKRHLIENKQRSDQTLARLQQNLDSTAPNVDKLPADQKAAASKVQELLKSMSDARKEYAAAMESKAQSDRADLGKLQMTATQLQTRIEQRNKELAVAATKPTNSVAQLLESRQKKLDELKKAREAALVALTSAQAAVKTARQQQVAADQAISRRDELKLKIEGERSQIDTVNRKVAVLKASPKTTVRPQEPTGDSVSSHLVEDPRPKYAVGVIALIVISFFFLTLTSATSRRDRAYEESLQAAAEAPPED